MAHLIDKDALVAEIEKRRDEHFDSAGSPSSEYCYEDDEILSIIDTFESKEVDLEKEINDYHITKKPTVWFNTLEDIAKHFFELGLKAQKEE